MGLYLIIKFQCRKKVQTLTLGTRTLILHEKIYSPEAITKMLWTHSLKCFVEKLNVLKVDDNGINPMEKFAGTTTYITLKNKHTWVCKVYVLDEILKGNIYGLPKLEPRSRAGIYIGHSLFHAESVALVLNPENGHVSPQFHVVFDDEFYTVPFMREGTIPPNWTDLVQRSSRSGAPENIDYEYTWFTPDIEKYLS